MASNTSILSTLRDTCLPSFLNLYWYLTFDTHMPRLGLSLYLIGTSQCPTLSLNCFSSSYRSIHSTGLLCFFICHVNPMASNASILSTLRYTCLPSFLNLYCFLWFETHIPRLGLSL